jgi:hypothetical protein
LNRKYKVRIDGGWPRDDVVTETGKKQKKRERRKPGKSGVVASRVFGRLGGDRENICRVCIVARRWRTGGGRESG